MEPDEAYLCHCRMCQRATGSVSIAFMIAQLDAVTWQGEPECSTARRSDRPFCAACGTSLGFGSSRTPTRWIWRSRHSTTPRHSRPRHHFGAESMHRAWINTEGLPEMRTDEHVKLVDKWVAATGKYQDSYSLGARRSWLSPREIRPRHPKVVHCWNSFHPRQWHLNHECAKT